MMMRLFGRKKTDPKQDSTAEATNPSNAGDLREAILRSREAIETLEKRQALLEKKISAQDELARGKAREGDKRGALFALKRKKMFEKELEQLGNAHLTLEQQIIALESAQTQQVAVGALAAGVVAQKALNQQLNVSKIDNLMEDIQEQVAMQNELAQILTQGAPVTDDSELLAELQALETRQLEEALVDATPAPQGIIGAPTTATTVWKPVGPATSAPAGRGGSPPTVAVEVPLLSLLASSSSVSAAPTRLPQRQLVDPVSQYSSTTPTPLASGMFASGRGVPVAPQVGGAPLVTATVPAPIECGSRSPNQRPATAGAYYGPPSVPNLELSLDRHSVPPAMSSARCSTGSPALLGSSDDQTLEFEPLPPTTKQHSSVASVAETAPGSRRSAPGPEPHSTASATDEQQFQKLLEELS